MRAWWLVVGGWWMAAPLSAQSEDQRAVLAVVQRLFDGMREKDTTRMRATLHPEARLVTTGLRDGAPVVGLVSPTQWLAGIPNAGATRLDERLRNPVVHLDMGLASVWAEYTFYLGDRFSHCGVDLIHLVKTADGWRIIDLADTRRRENCSP